MANKKSKEIVYFDENMTPDEFKCILDAIEGLIVVDKEGRIKYFSPDLFEEMEEFYEKPFPQKLAGRKITEVHPISKITNVFENKDRQEEYFYYAGGITSVARIKPVYKGAEVIGAVDYDLFANDWKLGEFMDRLKKTEEKEVRARSKTFRDLSAFLQKETASKYSVSDIIGQSMAIERIKQKIYNLTESDSTVLISGESGTGKELVAQAIHGSSMRRKFPMIEVNCAAIPENLFESELFGYEEGSFTGAAKGGKQGRFQMADKGTIFLDEVDAIPYHMQPKLLRALQEKEIVTVGGKKVKTDIRIIAATNKDLKKLTMEGKFREDLYYRLDVINMDVPPLRERKEDICLLAEHQIKKLNGFLNKSVRGISEDAIDLLEKYDWPGNIRELFNSIERAMNECTTDLLQSDDFYDLSLKITGSIEFETEAEKEENLLERMMEKREREIINKSLSINNGNITATARFLGISRPCLYYKIKKHSGKQVD